MDYVTGLVERITLTNEETGYSVIKIKSKVFTDLVCVVGSLAAVNVGATLRIKGSWKIDSKYGKQFSAMEYEKLVPVTLAGIEKYLPCSHFTQIAISHAADRAWIHGAGGGVTVLQLSI